MLLALLLLAMLAGAQLMQGWSAWHGDTWCDRFGGLVTERSLCAVTLVTGQVHYGTVVEVRRGLLRLADVYYAQSTGAPGGGPTQFQLVSRRNNDWHGPTWMAIAVNRIQSVDDVAPESRLANLIAQDCDSAARR